MNRDEILRQLKVREIIQEILEDPIFIASLLRYKEDFVFSDPRDIPSVGYIDSLILTGKDSKIIIKTGADVIDYELSLSGETNIPYPSVYKVYVGGNEATAQTSWDRSGNKIIGMPDVAEDSEVLVYFIGEKFTDPPVIPNTEISGMSFGSAEALQEYLIDKGNTGAIVTNYAVGPGTSETFTISGISSLASGTFAATDIEGFSGGDWLTGTIGGNCFLSCTSLVYFFAPNLSAIGLYALRDCTSLIAVTVPNVQTINPGAFKDSTGLDNKTIALPVLVGPNGLGGSAGDDTVFEGLTGLTVDINSTFQTNNAGGPDGDLLIVIANGGTVNYV